MMTMVQSDENIYYPYTTCTLFTKGCCEFLLLQEEGQITTIRFSVFSLSGPPHPPPLVLAHKCTKSLSLSLTLSHPSSLCHTHIHTQL